MAARGVAESSLHGASSEHFDFVERQAMGDYRKAVRELRAAERRAARLDMTPAQRYRARQSLAEAVSAREEKLRDLDDVWGPA